MMHKVLLQMYISYINIVAPRQLHKSVFPAVINGTKLLKTSSETTRSSTICKHRRTRTNLYATFTKGSRVINFTFLN